MPEATTPVSVVLTKAADLLVEHGWRRGRWGLDDDGYPNGAMCLEGAVLAALPREQLTIDEERGVHLEMYDECPAGQAVDEYLRSQGALHVGYDWNDNRNRTAEEVIAVLREAAAVEAAKEAVSA